MHDRRTTRRIAPVAAFAGGLLLGGLFRYAREVEPGDVEVTHVPLVLPRLDPAFDGYRVALIGDIHANDWMTPGRLLNLVKLVNAEKPDLVAIAGDFATYSPLRSRLHHATRLAAPLRRLRAPDGVFAVLGNHDHTAHLPARLRHALSANGEADDARREVASVVRRTLAQGGVSELQNTAHTLRRGDSTLHLCGLDSMQRSMGRPKEMLRNLPADGAAILLVHEPDFADAAAVTGRFDLQLSGHSHGGQVRLPLVGATALPPLGRKYPAGLYQLGDMRLYTNRGLGNHPRLRFLCRPEVTVLTLRSMPASQPVSKGVRFVAPHHREGLPPERFC